MKSFRFWLSWLPLLVLAFSQACLAIAPAPASTSASAVIQIPIVAPVLFQGHTSIPRLFDETKTIDLQDQQFVESISYATFRKTRTQIIVYVTNKATTKEAFQKLAVKVFAMQQQALGSTKVVSVVLSPALRQINIKVGSTVPLTTEQVSAFLAQGHTSFVAGRDGEGLFTLVSSMGHYLQTSPPNATPVAPSASQPNPAQFWVDSKSFIKSHLPTARLSHLPVKPLAIGLFVFLGLLIFGFIGLYFLVNRSTPPQKFSLLSEPDPLPVSFTPESK